MCTQLMADFEWWYRSAPAGRPTLTDKQLEAVDAQSIRLAKSRWRILKQWADVIETNGDTLSEVMVGLLDIGFICRRTPPEGLVDPVPASVRVDFADTPPSDDAALWDQLAASWNEAFLHWVNHASRIKPHPRRLERLKHESIEV